MEDLQPLDVGKPLDMTERGGDPAGCEDSRPAIVRAAVAFREFEAEAKRVCAVPRSFRLAAGCELVGDTDGGLHGLAGDFQQVEDAEDGSDVAWVHSSGEWRFDLSYGAAGIYGADCMPDSTEDAVLRIPKYVGFPALVDADAWELFNPILETWSKIMVKVLAINDEEASATRRKGKKRGRKKRGLAAMA